MTTKSINAGVLRRPAQVSGRNSGFTLIELTVVVTIIGILAAIAIPAYNEQVRKTRRADLTVNLSEIVQSKERFFTLNSTYINSPCRDSNDFYTIVCVDGPAAFSVTATRTAGQPQDGDACGTFITDQTGRKQIQDQKPGYEADDCW
ncbi:type IV pilin protein [Pseudomarimonas arenosa]|uniref:Prepilin-type N-terminal cleavage/methylation domain-containing protein n=1 Tax=Pseudomarimonas arenosa TaxID=2774145 RepID=A0AAW3ZSN8_9GAMM|nr:type IV pilin protein [Pseudomarimonas arenosa]MBD8528047.1 prepilin-type N-terminal cleavage/methylation domain-containing protein [Pseudomarimonas arenosa]